MNIIVIARTRNEELNIQRFCESYYWANKILIADGGSEDKTKEIAGKFPNVEIRDFTEKVWRHKIWRNPHGKHINFMVDWAEDENADWIIFDDVDCIPNFHIRSECYKIFEEAEEAGAEFILANRAYIYRDDRYFKDLTCPRTLAGTYDNEWIPSLWAWKANLGFRASEDNPFKHEFIKRPTDYPRKELYPPYSLLHYFYPTDEYMQRKINFYDKIYDFGNAHVRDPKEYGGQLLPLEAWMVK